MGDSYSCGDGSLGEYEAGVAWVYAHDSATNGFPWYVADTLNADRSIVARGGIGLFVGTSAQEGTVNAYTMADIYSYAGGYRTGEGQYSFSRKPDVVVVELGANDGINSSDSNRNMAAWASKLAAFIDQVRAKNGPDTKIVMLSHNGSKYYQMMKLVNDRASTDPNLFACHFSHNGNGSAALTTQNEGHPDAADHRELANALVSFMRTNGVLPAPETKTEYTDSVYYLAANGSDSNDGKSADKPKATLNGVLTAAKNGTYGEKDRIAVYVTGAVVGSSTQLIGNVGAIKNTAGQRVPILVTTKDFNGTDKAELKITFQPSDGGSSAIYSDNDFYFKDIIFKSYTASNGKFCANSFYSAGSDVTFDNVTLTTDKKCDYMTWIVSTGNFVSGGGMLDAQTKDVYSTITFLNGNYTDVYRASVTRDGVWTSGGIITSLPHYHGKLVIGEGATLKDVYGMYGALSVGSATVEICGNVTNYYPTASGTAEAPKTFTGDLTTIIDGGKIGNTIYSGSGNYVTINGDVTNTFVSGRYTGRQWNGLGSYVTLNGNLVNNMEGGEIRVIPTDGYDDGIYMAGHNNVTFNGNVTNNISGSDINLIYDHNVDSGIYLGTRATGRINGNLTNHMTGGNLYTANGAGKNSSNGIYLGMYSGNIYGTLTNHIEAGTIDVSASGGGINFGDRTIGNTIYKIVNILGKQGVEQGPRFLGSGVSLGGGWAFLGKTNVGHKIPDASLSTDEVVLENTIYGCYFGSSVYAGINGWNWSTSYSYQIGSTLTNIYGGKFPSGFYGSSGGHVYGHVTTNVYGGFFTNLVGGSSGTIHDGVELNIYGMEEYYSTNASNTWGIWAGSTTGAVNVRTSGRDAVKLTIAPKNATDLVLNTPIHAKCSSTGTINGNISVSVSRGTFPKGFAVTDKTVGQAIAAGSVAYSATGTKLTYAASDAKISSHAVIAPEGEKFGKEYVYYVSEQGNDSYRGTQPGSAKKTLNAAFEQLRADAGSYNLPAGSEVTIYVDGTVRNRANDSQTLGGSNIFYTGKSSVHIPFTITTYNYNGSNPATILCNFAPINNGNASMYVVNDLTFKDITLTSQTNTAYGCAMHRLYAAGCSLTFDNARLTTDGKASVLDGEDNNKWIVSADHYSTGGFNPLNQGFLPLYGTLTFKNGDYTNLNFAAAVAASSIWRDASAGGSVYEIPQMFCKLVIEEGAKMSNVYGTYGTLKIGSATVEVKGGEINNLCGTNSGTSAKALTYGTPLTVTISGGKVNNWMGSGDYAVINTNITNTLSGGEVGGLQFAGLGNNVTMNGNLTNNFTGGKLEITPTDTGNCGHGIFFSGRNNVTINGNVTNNLSGANVGVLFTTTNLQSGIWMGLRDGGKINGNLTNNISAGNIYTKTAEGVTAKYSDFHAGVFSGGVITGTLTNNITGGTFEIARGNFFFGQQGVSGSTGKIVNILGDKNTGNGPTFKGTNNIYLGGCFGRIGVASNIGTLPTVADCTDTLVICNTIYGGTFGGSVYGTNSANASTYVTYVKGSVQTDVYGGTFGTFCGTGNSPIYGRSVTNIHGGTFGDIWASGGAIVYDGTELNIYGLDEGCDPKTISAGAGNGVLAAQTAGRDALRFTIAPTGKLEISSALTVQPWGSGSVSGNTTVQVSGGTYTKGFSVAGTTVAKALAEGMVPVKADGTVVEVDSAMTTTGTDSVTIQTPPSEDENVVLGDFTGDGYVTEDDVIHLLWHTVDPEGNPLNQNGDFNGDGFITEDDVIHLLWYTVDPEGNPLK